MNTKIINATAVSVLLYQAHMKSSIFPFVVDIVHVNENRFVFGKTATMICNEEKLHSLTII